MSLLTPYITERSSARAASDKHPVYTFLVPPGANKPAVIAAVKADYKVTPLKVAMLTLKPRKIMMRGRVGYRPGGKKAVVYLKAGDKINFA